MTLLLGCSEPASSQSLPYKKVKAAHYRNEYYVSASHYDYSVAVDTIVGNTSSAFETAKRIYLWLCHNITFDPTYDNRTADICWDTRKAVCQGYCELFYRMAETRGVKCHIVYGKAKRLGPTGGTVEHAWIEAETEKGTILLDPTWGAGELLNGRFVEADNPMEWFNVNPQWFIFTHYPNKPVYQHLATPITETDFLSFPFITPRLSLLGLTSTQVMQRVRNGEKVFPRLNLRQMKNIEIVSVPKKGQLKVGEVYIFTIRKRYECQMFLQNEDYRSADTEWLQTEQGLTCVVRPKNEGHLQLMINLDQGYFVNEVPVLDYEVDK